MSSDTEQLLRARDEAFWVGSTYALLGDKDLAFKWLNKAVKLGNENRPHFEHSKNLDSLRDDPRFAELMAKMGNNKQQAA